MNSAVAGILDQEYAALSDSRQEYVILALLAEIAQSTKSVTSSIPFSIVGGSHLAGYVATAFLLFGCFVHAAAWADEPKTALCNTCSTGSQFGQSAEIAATSTWPILTEGSQEVYVVNPMTNVVRFFVVTREFIGETVGFGDGFWSTTTSPAAGDPERERVISGGVSAVQNFVAQLAQGVFISELSIDLPSAIDLVGPEDSSAGLARTGLNNSLRDFMRVALSNTINDFVGAPAGSLRDVLQVVVDIALKVLAFGQQVTIEFDDGTKIRVIVKEILAEMDGQGGIEGVDFVVEVDAKSAQGPGLPGVPSGPGQFGGFTFEGDSRIVDRLTELANRYGIPVTPPGGGSTCTIMECDPPQPNAAFGECRVTPC
ncbi:MAG: hypothetical protein LC637_12960 [Xanthomonadaceae bacterium]|nr:hypothetical protein [Xanthomonadaceae bacterium]